MVEFEGRLVQVALISSTRWTYPDGGKTQRLQELAEQYAQLFIAAPALLATCEAFVEAWEKSLQLEKTDVALRMAKQAIAATRPAVEPVTEEEQ